MPSVDTGVAFFSNFLKEKNCSISRIIMMIIPIIKIISRTSIPLNVCIVATGTPVSDVVLITGIQVITSLLLQLFFSSTGEMLIKGIKKESTV